MGLLFVHAFLRSPGTAPRPSAPKPAQHVLTFDQDPWCAEDERRCTCVGPPPVIGLPPMACPHHFELMRSVHVDRIAPPVPQCDLYDEVIAAAALVSP